MSILIEGRVAQFVLLMLFFAFGLYSIWRSKKSKEPIYMKTLPPIDAISEAVGRCVEMGKSLHFSPGLGKLDPQTIAALSVLSYAAEECAKRGSELIVSINKPEIIPLTETIVRQAYTVQGVPRARGRIQ